MKKIFIEPEMNISYFRAENIVTSSGGYAGTSYSGDVNTFKSSYDVIEFDWNELEVVE